MQQSLTPFTAIVRGALIGAISGVPLSYYFQPGMLRAFFSITKYLATLPKTLSVAYKDSLAWDVTATVLFTMAALAAVGGVVGWGIHALRAAPAVASAPTQSPDTNRPRQHSQSKDEKTGPSGERL